MEFEMISGKKHQLHARFEAPLSITQERVWFLSELNRGCSLFHTALAVRFEGMVDVAILQRGVRGRRRTPPSFAQHAPPQ
jgi:hypothetical protein